MDKSCMQQRIYVYLRQSSLISQFMSCSYIYILVCMHTENTKKVRAPSMTENLPPNLLLRKFLGEVFQESI